MAPVPAAGVRLAYDDLPPAVQHWITTELGGEIVSATTQTGGFSPGTAARLVASNGRRAFVKAVGTPLNPDSPGIHRSELAAVKALPDLPFLPDLIGEYDDGEWVGLLFEDIEGRLPSHPWAPADVELVFDALGDLAAALTPSPWADAPGHEERGIFSESWRLIAADPPSDLPSWVTPRLESLIEMDAHTVRVLAGDALAHFDIRADNLLITPENRVVVVDWSWASTAAPWTDVALTTLDLVASESNVDVDELLARHPLTRDVPPEDITAVISACAGLLVDRARHPAPPGLPTIRAYQHHFSRALLDWTRRRTGW